MLLAAAIAWFLIVVVFLVMAHADDAARRDRDCSRSQTRPPTGP
ncbi:hypothetical protein AB0E62_27345 [Streptomyces sp. NPDC038707]